MILTCLKDQTDGPKSFGRSLIMYRMHNIRNYISLCHVWLLVVLYLMVEKVKCNTFDSLLVVVCNLNVASVLLLSSNLIMTLSFGNSSVEVCSMRSKK